MTPEQIDEMSATELRKAIAYRLGWRKLQSIQRTFAYVCAPGEVAE
jgi:hypothetical protein